MFSGRVAAVAFDGECSLASLGNPRRSVTPVVSRYFLEYVPLLLEYSFENVGYPTDERKIYELS